MSELEYGLLGEKLGHSFSPAIHRKLAGYDYQLVEKKPEELADFLTHGTFQGLNVTIPYKKAVIPFCRTLTDQARRIGSVNTIVRQKDGTLLGHNTDYDGFAYMLRSAGAELRVKKALILGTGGVSPTVKTVLEDLGAGEIVFISRSGPDNYENLERHAAAQVLVNATPVGMYPNTEVSPVDLDRLPNLEGVFDLIYNPARTRLLLQAEERGLCRANGLGMLVAQAKRSSEQFSGTVIDNSVLERVERTVNSHLRNIILIGMPGCGKSTVAAALGRDLGREVVEADTLIAEKAGMSIPEIFAQSGEDGFRALETEILAEQGKRSGIILSTGGGCVTRQENYPLLHQNGTIFCLTRGLSKLPTAGRPISQSTDLAQLYARRKPLYERFADCTVSNDGALQDTLNTIKEALK